jgi:SAM-dependent methyltransferase
MARIRANSGENYEYVGTDISFQRLRVAHELIPEGEFVQASALKLPFADRSFQGVLLFGVLHHLSEQYTCLCECHRVLSEGGMVGLHEPIAKPLMIPASWRRIRGALETYQHSEHDREIDAVQTISTARALRMRVVVERYSVSPLRTLVDGVLGRAWPRLLAVRSVVMAINELDRLVLATIGRVWRRMGPHGVVLVLAKEYAE